jgi:hypothetical protein
MKSAALLLLALAMSSAAQSSAPLPRYRARILGVFNAQTGDPIEGAEVIDVFTNTKALTTVTGTVSLSFLPDGGSMVRVQKIGFSPETNVVPISEADTLPFMIMLRPAQTLPKVVTTDTARKYVSPALNAFEERRRSSVGGKFITPEQLRKSDNRKMTDVIREIGVPVSCAKVFPYPCYATSTRQGSKNALLGGHCDYDIYLDGNKVSTADYRDLQVIKVSEIGAVEAYMGPASMPIQYNATGSSCGAILFWSRER